MLTDSDEIKLLGITEEMGDCIQKLLADFFADAASHLRSLQHLSIINHIKSTPLLNQSKVQIVQYFEALIDDFKTNIICENFMAAKALLVEVEKGFSHFEKYLDGSVDMKKLT